MQALRWKKLGLPESEMEDSSDLVYWEKKLMELGIGDDAWTKKLDDLISVWKADEDLLKAQCIVAMPGTHATAKKVCIRASVGCGCPCRKLYWFQLVDQRFQGSHRLARKV